MYKRLGRQTVCFENPPAIISHAAIAGKKEGDGPLKNCFDVVSSDSYFGQKSWEKAETEMLRQCFDTACRKAGISSGELDYVLAGDLLNQCVSSSFAMKDSKVPYFGLYGACSTMVEAISLGAMLVDGGFAGRLACLTGSHFCTAERQYRLPLEYGGQRTPSAQWTVTGAGAVILSSEGRGRRISHVTTGCIVDAGIDDACNMGAAMAPAAYDTIRAHFDETGRGPEDYDAIFTGDLGALGHDILQHLFDKDGVKLGVRYMDCGVLIYDLNTQDVHAGGSGCGCCASVLAGHILRGMENGVWNRVLVCATGALMSTTTSQQGSTIPGICHAIAIESEAGR